MAGFEVITYGRFWVITEADRGCGCHKGCLEFPQSGDRSDPFFLYPMG